MLSRSRSRSRDESNQPYIIATYNMSFASDLGLNPESNGSSVSESEFLKKNIMEQRLKRIPEDKIDLRAYWKNAVEHLLNFCREKEPSAIGLQEMNNTGLNVDSGTGYISYELNRLYPNLTSISMDIDVGKYKAGLMTIWDRVRMGEIQHASIYDLGETVRQLGRPILFLYTTSGYLLINLHAPQNISMRILRDLINESFREFIKNIDGSINVNKVFVMGDFNDSKENIQGMLKLPGIGELLYLGEAPKSCCYSDYPGSTDSLYTNAGDYVFGKNPIRTLQIFEPVGQPIKSQSDHELVYGVFVDGPVIGGRKTKRSKRKNNNKSRNKKTKRKYKHTRKTVSNYYN